MQKADLKTYMREAFGSCQDMELALAAANDRMYRHYLTELKEELGLIRSNSEDFATRQSLMKRIEEINKVLES